MSKVLHLKERLERLGIPVPLLTGPTGIRPTAKDLREGQFNVHRRPAKLIPPIDWRQDPYASRTWRYQLHSLIWLKPLFLDHAETGNRDVLDVALDVVVDWVSAHRNGAAEVSEFAWYDMAVSQRAPALAYALRIGLAEDALDDRQASLLLSACNRHGQELSDEIKYSAGHNHGLAQDEGLYLLARQLPVLPAAQAWSELAANRLRRTLKATISLREGGHLEHSTEYQFAITRMVTRLAETAGAELPALPELRDRLREHAAWHVMPNRRNAQLGDTDDHPSERWAIDAAAGQRGLSAFPETGTAFVRSGGSYLASTAAYHSDAHKQSDETGFILVEENEVLLGDAGRWGYYEDELDRRYARSALAHNVLTVDDRDFGWRDSAPYGSGLLATGEGDGWFAILSTNPLLARQGVRHRRLLLYRPGELLVVIDEARAAEPHDYARRFHFGPGLDASLDAEGRVTITGNRISATLTDLGCDFEIELARGCDEPARLGWTYPGDRERLPVWTGTLRSHAADSTMTAVLSVGGSSTPSVVRAELDADRAMLETAIGTVEIGFSEPAYDSPAG